MSELQEKLKDIAIEIDKSSTIIDKLEIEHNKLKNTQKELFLKSIIEDKLLAKTKWELKIHPAAIEIVAIRNDFEQIIQEMLNPSWHDYYNLEDKILLSFDDNKVSIHFDRANSFYGKDDLNYIFDFIQRSGIKIKTTDQDKERKKFEEEFAITQQIIDLFKGKDK